MVLLNHCKLLALLVISCVILVENCASEDILGCGGFIKSHANIDFSKVHIKLYTKAGSLKDRTECAPNNGYYFLPLYDKGEYILKVDPPYGWSFEPTEVTLDVDGTSDVCSQGKDINFVFKGFGITGKVVSSGSNHGPAGVTVSLYKDTHTGSPVGSTTTAPGGTFYFTPIQPGKYVLVASHPVWVFEKSVHQVTVLEGNTELPDKSLVVFGYDVSGRVTSEDEPVAGVSFVLFGTGKTSKTGCATTPIQGFETEKQPLCHVISDKSGRFEFAALTNGDYRIIPHYAGAQTKFDVEPSELSFTVRDASLILAPNFRVTGFTVTGTVHSSAIGQNVQPLEGARVFISGQQVAITDKNGIYTIDKIKTGQYKLRVEADNLRFDDTTIKVSPSSPQIRPIAPTSYKVCGSVKLDSKSSINVRDNNRKIAVENVAVSSFREEIPTNSKTGEYCLYLAPGTYQLSVIVSNEEKTKGLQFFPLQQTIDVSSKPVANINFLQLKAKLDGMVRCLRQGFDCTKASVTLKILDGLTVKTLQPEADGNYAFDEVLPGHYEVLIDTDLFCWENPSHRVSITSERAQVPDFKQTGFAVTFITSHDTAVEFTTETNEINNNNNNNIINKKKQRLELERGSTRHCVSQPGEYKFVPKGCHVFPRESYTWDTNNNNLPIILTSTEHIHRGKIVSSASLNDVTVKIDYSDVGDKSWSKVIGPLKAAKSQNHDLYQYEFDFIASTDKIYTITPLSNILLFDPPSAKVIGINDCHNDIVTFTGELGKIVSGRLSPPLEGVTIQIFGTDKNSPVRTLVTDNSGTYKVGPLDGKIDYSVTAEKEGFVITGPDADQVFLAHKLAQVIVQVSDNADGASLQGVLLSLSGGESYRRNSVTNEEGSLIFNSLSPGEYFLRPMMKEYRFDPPFKMITVAEGASINVKLSGTRVAFSAYGTVTSLNGQPEPGVIVEAQGQSECNNLQEEAITEDNGNFRIRGLEPTCIYAVRLKPEVQANEHIERAAPSSIAVQATTDVYHLRFIAFYPTARTDLSVHIISSKPEYYRTLRVKLCREDLPDSPIHTSKLDFQHSAKIASSPNSPNAQSWPNPGFLVHFPPLPANGKKYFLQLESSLSQTLYKYRTTPIYFAANSSFKQVTLKFEAERKADQAEMSQTSMVALPFIMLLTLAFINREKLCSWFNSQIEQWSKMVKPVPRQSVQTIPIDPRADDIIVEQIMNINKRKPKPRKA